MNHFVSAAIAAILTVPAIYGQAPVRKITFNGKDLTGNQMQTIETLEERAGVRLPDAAYWYDNFSGAMGFWNGPAAAVIPAGLRLGGTMPWNCSGGATSVFVNGRSLHPLDISALSRIVRVQPGQFWVDARGNFGYVGGVALGNLVALSNQNSRRPQHRTFSNSELGVIVNEAGACTSSGCYYPGK